MGLTTLLATLLATVGISPAHVRWSRCGAQSNATSVQVADMGCGLAHDAIVTYEGAPEGCTTSRTCVQSGLHGDQALFDQCQRSGLKVACTVYVHNAHGPVRDPRVGGAVLRSRFDRGFVSFTLRHRLAP